MVTFSNGSLPNGTFPINMFIVVGVVEDYCASNVKINIRDVQLYKLRIAIA